MVLQGTLYAFPGPILELGSQPFALRSLDGALGSLCDRVVNQTTRNVAEELFARAVLDFALVRLPEGKFEKTVIHEGFPQFNRGSHRDPIIKPQRLGYFGESSVKILSISQHVRERMWGAKWLCQRAEAWNEAFRPGSGLLGALNGRGRKPVLLS